jgi:hypothetical protein
MNVLLIFILVAVVFFLIKCKTSSFGDIQQIANNNYGSSGCSRENREYPSGHIPASWLGLTTAERTNLLKKFIENEST